MPLAASSAARQGFTIVELVVAILIFTVGVLGLVSSSALVTQQLLVARRRTNAAALADTRFETMQNTTCSAIVGGTATARHITEHWVVRAYTTRSKSVTDTVTFAYGRNLTSKANFNSVIPCY